MKGGQGIALWDSRMLEVNLLGVLFEERKTQTLILE